MLLPCQAHAFTTVEIINVKTPLTDRDPGWVAYPTPQSDFVRDPRHIIESVIISVDDDPAAQQFDQYALVASAIFEASKLHIDIPGQFVNVFPGDHYRLLAAFIKILQPQLMLDIGTFTGLSARIMGEYSNSSAEVITYDVVPYADLADSVLTPNICTGLTIDQYLQDLSDPEMFAANADLLKRADFIMCDGPKDGKFEPAFIQRLAQLEMPIKQRWLFMDDIRFMGMAGLWRAIQSPKIDLTSFGHFSGTGLVDISKGLIIKI